MPSANNRSAVEFLQALLDAVFDAIEHDEAAIRELYEESGIDRNELVTNILKRVKAVRVEQRLAAARSRREELLSLLASFKEQSSKLKKKDLIEKLREFIEPEEGSSGALAFFHKLESMPEDDMREMLKEVDFLKLLEKSKKGG